MSRDIFIFNNRNNPAEGYYQITEAELQLYKKSYDGKPFIINLGYALMEVTEADYKDFYRVRRREKYIQEEAIRVGEFSYNTFDTGYGSRSCRNDINRYFNVRNGTAQCIVVLLLRCLPNVR